MRRRDGKIPPKKSYSEIMEDLNNTSEEFKQTMFYKRLVMRAEIIRESEALGKKFNDKLDNEVKI
ncbi:MAG: hypothetical protein K2K75_06145 [Muribaculaceae bacterium]|nr:hypothetical protein [Muribaculaceae bacterium]